MVLVVVLHIRYVVFASDTGEQAHPLILREAGNHYFIFDYCLSSVTTLARGMLMSFFDTEEAHAGILVHFA